MALAAARAAGRSIPIRELARELGRGQRSGIGVAAFERGGLVIDAGHRADDDARRPPSTRRSPRRSIFQHPLPDDWHFVLATPRAAPGLSGAAEQQAFRDLPPMAAERVGRICRLTLMQVIPAVLTDDIRTFGAAITEIQAIVGEYFAPHQGGRFATQTGCEVTEHALARGAHGVGQSSWGPTVFALVRGRERRTRPGGLHPVDLRPPSGAGRSSAARAIGARPATCRRDPARDVAPPVACRKDLPAWTSA